MHMKDINTRLRVERRKRGWTQKELGDMVGIRQALLSDIETGRANPTPDELAALARALNISPPEIILKPVKVVLEEVAP